SGVAAGAAGDLLGVGGGGLVAVPGGGNLLARLAREDRPAAAGVGQGLAQGVIVGHGVLRGRVWPQRVVSVASWAARAGRMRAWYSARQIAARCRGRPGGTAPTTGWRRCPGRTGTGRGRASTGRGGLGGRSRAGRPGPPSRGAGRPARAGHLG